MHLLDAESVNMIGLWAQLVLSELSHLLSAEVMQSIFCLWPVTEDGRDTAAGSCLGDTESCDRHPGETLPRIALQPDTRPASLPSSPVSFSWFRPTLLSGSS